MPGTPAPSGAKFASEAAGGGLSDCVPAALVFSRELAIDMRGQAEVAALLRGAEPAVRH